MFGFGQVPQSELEALRVACKGSLAAYKGCKKANPGSESACANLETHVLACLAAKVCKGEKEAFDKCTAASHVTSTAEGRLRTYKQKGQCDKQIEAMGKCLRRKKVWPRLESVT